MIETTVDELLKHELPVAVRVLKSFDPMALRNEIAGRSQARGFELKSGVVGSVRGQ